MPATSFFGSPFVPVRAKQGEIVAPRRKATTSDPVAAAPVHRTDAADRASSPTRVVLVSTGFLLCLAAYLLLFYSAEFVPGRQRYRPLGFVMVPDELISDWLGRPHGEFAMLDRLGPLSVAGGIVGAAFLLGWLILPHCQSGERLQCAEFLALATGLGLSGLSVATLVIGLLGGLRQPFIFLLLGLMLLAMVAWRAWRRGVCQRLIRGSAAPQPPPATCAGAEAAVDARCAAWWRPRWWWAAVPFVLVTVGGAVLPPFDFDVLEYHLQVPKEWYQQGSVTFLPHNVYGNMPLGAEMLVTLAMATSTGDPAWWWGALAGKVVMASFSLLTALLIFAAGCRYFSRTVGIVASLLYVSTPWIVMVSINGLNEGVMAYYLMAGVYTGRLWWDRRRQTGAPCWGLLMLTGWMAGSAVACKYTSVLLIVGPLLIVTVLGSRMYRVRIPLVFLLTVSAACGLWFGKNWALSGNPTYPLLFDVFGGETRTAAKDAQWRRAHQVPRDGRGNRYSLSQAWQATVNVLGRSVWHSPVIVPFVALVFWRSGRYRELAYWAGPLCFILVAWWLLTHRLDRFWVPALPLMVLLAGVGAAWSGGVVWRRIMWTVLAGGLLANFVLVASPLTGDNRYFVALRQLRDDSRMLLVSNAHRLNAHAFMRDWIAPESRVLLVGDAAAFDLPFPVLYNTCFDDCIFEEIFRQRDVSARCARLRELQISYVYIDWADIERYRQPGNYGFSEFVTRQLVHQELELEQQLLQRLDVPGLDPADGELFAVRLDVD